VKDSFGKNLLLTRESKGLFLEEKRNEKKGIAKGMRKNRLKSQKFLRKEKEWTEGIGFIPFFVLFNPPFSFSKGDRKMRWRRRR
jgi:hypothetical protein